MKSKIHITSTILMLIAMTFAIELDVPSFSQRDAAWASNELGTCGITVGDYGCAVTCKAMVFNYYSFDYTDPGELNTCLTDSGGYIRDCVMLWNEACIPPGVDYHGWSNELTYVDTFLLMGYPVISSVTTSSDEQHFIVFVGNEGGLRFLDPWDTSRILRTWPNGAISGGYSFVPTGGVSHNDKIRVYSGTPSETFIADYVHESAHPCQTDPGEANNVLPGQHIVCTIEFKNTGSATWRSNGYGTTDPNYVEFNPVDSDEVTIINSPLWIPGLSEWTDSQRIKFLESSISSGDIGHIKFTANIPTTPGTQIFRFRVNHRYMGNHWITDSSNYFRFDIGPALELPTNGSVLDTRYPIFQWTYSSLQESARIVIYKDSECTIIRLNRPLFPYSANTWTCDEELGLDSTYWWKVDGAYGRDDTPYSFPFSFTIDTTSGNINNEKKPKAHFLYIFPNPFNSSCAITIPSGANVEIYDLNGKCIGAFDKTPVIWQPDESISSGIYLVRARMEDGRTASKRIIYLK